MTTKTEDNICRTGSVFPLIMEYGTYLFAVLMFAGKFGTLREIGLYLPAFLWLLQGILEKKMNLEWREPLFIALVALSLSAAVSSFLSTSPSQSLHFFKREYLKVILLYVVISSTFGSRERLKRFALLLAVTGIVYLIVGYTRIATDLLRTGTIHYDETRYYATVFLFFFSFFLLQNISTTKIRRVLWTIPLIVSMAGILLIGVRGSWLALFGILCIWIYFLKESSKNIFTVLKIGIPPIITVIIIIFILFPGQYQLIKEHTVQKVQMSLRVETWNTFLMMSQERFFTGHGLDDAAMTEHYREFYKGLKGAYPVEGFNPTTPHNQFIKILYQQGMAGLLLYVALLGMLFWRTIKTFLRDRERDYAFVGIAVIAAVLGEYVIRCLTEDRSLVPLSLLLGMAGAYLNLRERSEGRGGG
ncbi:MAG: O-antigen ligase family protein [Nitrospirae bacterium]|nr:O-antigen ligase family protein [Nitrospirota bacterium]